MRASTGCIVNNDERSVNPTMPRKGSNIGTSLPRFFLGVHCLMMHYDGSFQRFQHASTHSCRFDTAVLSGIRDLTSRQIQMPESRHTQCMRRYCVEAPNNLDGSDDKQSGNTTSWTMLGDGDPVKPTLESLRKSQLTSRPPLTSIQGCTS